MSSSHQVATMPKRRTGSTGSGLAGFAAERDHRRPMLNCRLHRPAAERIRFVKGASTCVDGALFSGTGQCPFPSLPAGKTARGTGIERASGILPEWSGATAGRPFPSRTASIPARRRCGPVRPGYRVCATALVPGVECRGTVVGVMREYIALEEGNRGGDDPPLGGRLSGGAAVLAEYAVGTAGRPGGRIAVRKVRGIEVDDVISDGHIGSLPQAAIPVGLGRGAGRIAPVADRIECCGRPVRLTRAFGEWPGFITALVLQGAVHERARVVERTSLADPV